MNSGETKLVLLVRGGGRAFAQVVWDRSAFVLAWVHGRPHLPLLGREEAILASSWMGGEIMRLVSIEETIFTFRGEEAILSLFGSPKGGCLVWVH